MNNKRYVLATLPVEVTSVSATLSPPDTIAAGGVASVGWTGPGDDGDYLAFFPRGETRYATWRYVKDGDPLEIKSPAEPGSYDLVYVQRQDNYRLVSVPVEVVAVSATVTTPSEPQIEGATIPIEWTGPDNEGDYIALFPVGSDRYSSWKYTKDGTPISLPLRASPGDYEVVYVQGTGNKRLASAPLKVAAAQATLSPPASAQIGQSIQVDWTGPGFDRDYIGIYIEGEPRYLHWSYVNKGEPVTLKMPSEPGRYEVGYSLAEGNTVILRVAIDIVSTTAQSSVQGDLIAGQMATVAWDGPDNPGDYIAVTDTGEEGRYLKYSYTRNGSPLQIQLPNEPGNYAIVYKLEGKGKVIGRIPVTVK